MTVYRSMCSLDCFDSCAWQVEVKNGRVLKVSGDPDHPFTRGKVCPKAALQVERMYSIDRLRRPLRKTASGWRKVSWREALGEIAERLGQIVHESGSTAVLHNVDSGNNGLLNDLDRRFFNALGGATVTRGCLCWGAGQAAQRADFGASRAHAWEDVLNSNLVVLWGRNVAETNRHLLPFLQEVKQQGGKIAVINPVNIKLPFTADYFVQVKPGMDGALALGMAHVICRERWLDLDFVAAHVDGFAEFLTAVSDYRPERVAEVTGVPTGQVEQLAAAYARAGAASIFLGLGMQRYRNGGQTVRAIDALAAITGNVGRSGGGVNYSYSGYKCTGDIKGEELARQVREISYPRWGQEVLELTEPPVRAIVVTRSNPVTQLPGTAKVLEAFRRAEFVVTVDFVLNDTAVESDLVLPCAAPFESENIVINGMNRYLGYTPKMVEPQGECRPDAWIFSELAREMGLKAFGQKSAAEWMDLILAPYTPYHINLEVLKEKSIIANPLAEPVAWSDRQFATPSGKVELSVPTLKESGYHDEDVKGRAQYPLMLLTPHSGRRIHSQFLHLQQEGTAHMPVHVHPQTAIDYGLVRGGLVQVESAHGQAVGSVVVDSNVLPGVVMVESGLWMKFGGGINLLTPDFTSDIGETAAYYDCRCAISRCRS